LWKRKICATARNDDTYASPVIAAGRVLLGVDVIADRPTDTGREIALDATSGNPAWSFTPVRYRGTGGGISTTPVVDARAGLAFLGTGNPTPMNAPPPGSDPYTDSVIAFDIRTGSWRWVAGPLIPHDTNDFDVFASPKLFTLDRNGMSRTAVGDVLKDSAYVMLDERNGHVIWRRQIEPAMSWMQVLGTPAVSDGTIVVAFYHSPLLGGVAALRARDGAVLWRTQTAGIYEAPVIWRKVVFAGEARGVIDAFRLGDGHLIMRRRIGSELYGHGLALDGNTLFVADRAGLTAYAILP
jgi:outer membrane protein assembly factor BamB